MITVERDGSNVKVCIDLDLPVDRDILVVERPETYEYQACLVADRINLLLQRKLKRIRKEAYEKGWKDAKSRHAKKQTDFCEYWSGCV